MTPRLVVFAIHHIEVEVPSSRPNRTPCRVIFAGAQAPKCNCMGYCSHKHCRHQREALDFLFSLDGLYASLECVDLQLAALPQMNASLGCYHAATLVGLRDEIARRIGEIEVDEMFELELQLAKS